MPAGTFARAVDLLEFVPVTLPDAIEEPRHGLPLRPLFDFGLAALFDEPQIVLDPVDVVQESPLAIEEAAPNHFHRLAADSSRDVHRDPAKMTRKQ